MSTLWELVAARHEGGPLNRVAKADLCPRCDRPRLYGLDDDWCALDSKVDPEPLSALGEVQATIAGLRTFELRRSREGFSLDRRHEGSIRGRPAGSGVVDVLAEHRCGVVLATGPPVLRPRISANATDVPDF